MRCGMVRLLPNSDMDLESDSGDKLVYLLTTVLFCIYVYTALGFARCFLLLPLLASCWKEFLIALLLPCVRRFERVLSAAL